MPTMQFQRWRRAGFTLIEILTVLLILSLLVVLALPSYTSYLRRTHRAEVRVAMQRAALWMERAATAQGRYPLSAEVPAALLQLDGTPPFYTLSIESPDGSQLGTATYRIVATRNPQTNQGEDECGDLVLDQAQRRNILNTSSGADATTCWTR